MVKYGKKCYGQIHIKNVIGNIGYISGERNSVL